MEAYTECDEEGNISYIYRLDSVNTKTTWRNLKDYINGEILTYTAARITYQPKRTYESERLPSEADF